METAALGRLFRFSDGQWRAPGSAPLRTLRPVQKTDWNLHQVTHRSINRRHGLRWAAGATAAVGLQRRAQNASTIRRVGIFSLLGDSVRSVAREMRETQEALLKEVGMGVGRGT